MTVSSMYLLYSVHGLEATKINKCNAYNVNAMDVNDMNEKRGAWIEKIEIKMKKIPYKIDSGAEIDVLPLSIVKKLMEK